MAAICLAGPARADTLIVPSLTVSERYDSNVYFVSAEENLEDFVTTVIPAVSVKHRGTLVDATLGVAMTGEYYLNNPALNYFFPSGSLGLNLDRYLGQWNRRLKLSISETFQYTPRPPAFVTPVPEGTVGATPDFIRGIQAIRANSIMNSFTATSAYLFSAATQLNAVYSHQYMRFSNPYGSDVGVATPGGGFFTTSFHTVTVGPQTAITARDTIRANFQFQHIGFQTGAEDTTFTVFGGNVGWRRQIKANLIANGNIGLLRFDPGGTIAYTGDASLQWTVENTTTIASYSRGVFPSFFIAAVPLLSQTFAVAVNHKLSQNWTLSGGVNYAQNESIPAGIIAFNSYGGSATATYLITRTFTAKFEYTYNQFDTSFGEQSYSFDRNVVSISLSKQFQ
jgi:hypothetical protein